MANRVEATLTDELLPILRKEQYVTLGTTDHENGGPNINAISWVYAQDKKSIRFAVDNRSRIVENIRKSPIVTVTLIGAGSTYAITGNAHILLEKIEGVPLKLALIEIKITEVRDVMFYGARITEGPKYEKIYDKEAAEKLDTQVMEAMKNA
ncbi:pyridoxamine 5'-phosphate oxidase family protein [Evansella cellulosilytica]|uniref:Pyridoxamine 5'-phosphate oxidase-related FMN-binding protein n=1 Tax=Evansella cellulosilytica (strain ATCC 21833 / DSM 2522 / FERM P-1141 / JCM 9156 / N-4) TaxID=649639 RepID=E6TUL5_EVAC2|nr:pyridoxamine 5'-phosphate oxidase family protein [Evansella cellulosilytica]ADU30905.1 pyridoxamine 5'-phosphate oxidase-related FMN-binding protein [Evansella cellulosilytica DSM 2522]